jgi:hypothetical protein
MLALWLDHQKGMIEQDDLEIPTVALGTTTFLQRAFVYKLSTFLVESQVLCR